jgi:Predicted membrane protein (DUF2254)
VARVTTLATIGAFGALAAASFALFAVNSFIDGVGAGIVADPAGWLARLSPDAANSLLFNTADIVAGLLGVAITVSAIVVQLAATRYNHRITWLFLREPFNIVVWSLYLLTVLQCVWVAVSRDTGEAARLPGAAVGITLVLVSVCLLLLLPYFVFVFRFLSPLSIIFKIKGAAYRCIERAQRAPSAAAKREVLDAIDQIQDVARSATEQSDRSVAMACVDALHDLMIDYQAMRPRLLAEWFTVGDAVAENADFVSLAHSVLQEIEEQRLWLEVKIFRQYISLMANSLPDAREVAYLIAINTADIATQQGARNRALLELCIKCVNSFLRESINALDARTSYYLMNQYRILAESLVEQGLEEPVREIAGYLKYYGNLAHEKGLSFLLQTAAGDMTSLVEASLTHSAVLTDDLLTIVLDVDQEIRSETQEESLLGVRRAQLQLATLFALRGDDARAQRICKDLAGERMVRLQRLRVELENERRPQYWELNERGVNFGYLPPERRAQLPKLMQWIADYSGSQ